MNKMVTCSVALLLLAGCAGSPRTTFYTLAPTPGLETSDRYKTIPTVAIAAVSLPELVDRPQMVLPDGGTTVTILETRRWAEPLKNAIPRVLAENLSRIIGGDRVSFYPQHAAVNADYRVFIDVQRFETIEGAVVVDALWSIRPAGTGGAVAHRSQFVEAAGGTGYEHLTAAYSRALGSLSKEIAGVLLSMHTNE
jgi:uncharacterized lipoprotein YmbA